MEEALFDLVVRLEASLDFPDEGYHFLSRDDLHDSLQRVHAQITGLLATAHTGRLIREGAQVVLTGKPNVGKSALFNALLRTERAIVTPVPGTTRDLLAERCDIEGIAVTLVDTAGVRETADEIEREGVARAEGATTVADAVVVVLDASQPFSMNDEQMLARAAERPAVVAVNKADQPPVWELDRVTSGTRAPVVRVSALTGEGLTDLRSAIARALGASDLARDAVVVANLRHTALLQRAEEVLGRALAAATQGAAEEFLLLDIGEAIRLFDQINGRRAPDEVLNAIFSRFCLGK